MRTSFYFKRRVETQTETHCTKYTIQSANNSWQFENNKKTKHESSENISHTNSQISKTNPTNKKSIHGTNCITIAIKFLVNSNHLFEIHETAGPRRKA